MGIQLPPQAYTRDTMIQAYEWLQSQPPSIRELASSPDALVSLYMQARRRGNSSVAPSTSQLVNTHPVSSQAFKQDLKNLAEGMRQFESNDDGHAGNFSQQPMAHPGPNMQSATGATASPTVNVMVSPGYQNPGYQNHGYQPPSVNIENDDIYGSLDSKSHDMVRRVQSRFNLSTEKEALRMLIALGFDKVREMLPKG